MEQHQENYFKSTAIACIALLLMIRLLVLLLAVGPVLSGDGYGYYSVATNIVQSFSLPPLRIQPHGYPVLISPIILAFSDNPIISVQIFQVFLDVILVGTLGVLVWKSLVVHSVAIAMIAVIAIVIQPFTATMTTSLYSESLNTSLLTISVILFARSTSNGVLPIGACLMLGLAATTRVDLIVLSLLLCIIYWVIAKREGLLSNRVINKLPSISLVSMLFISLSPVVLLLFIQYRSTGEIGVVRYEPSTQGYYSWMRTWFSTAKEYEKFGFGVGKENWKGFDIEVYPEKSFINDAEKEQVITLLSSWESGGYSEHIDQAFKELQVDKRNKSLFNYYIIVPMLRMTHYWVNLDGAQSLIRAVDIKRPWSLFVVAATISLRIMFLVLSVIGSLLVWKRSQKNTIPEFLKLLGQAASVLVVLRTLEMGALGTIAWGGLMEVRYVNITFPLIMLLSCLGVLSIIRNTQTQRKRI